MINRFSILILTFVLLSALIISCGGDSDDDQQDTPNSSKTLAPTSDDAQIIKDAEAFFANPPQFELNLDGEKAFDDFAVPDVRMDIPDIGMESLDFDLEFDTDVSVDGSFTVPSASSLLGDLPGLAGSGMVPPAGYVPTAQDCAGFANVPCSFVPPQYQDLCEQCRELGY